MDTVFIKNEVKNLCKCFEGLDKELKGMKDEGLDKFKASYSVCLFLTYPIM